MSDNRVRPWSGHGNSAEGFVLGVLVLPLLGLPLALLSEPGFHPVDVEPCMSAESPSVRLQPAMVDPVVHGSGGNAQGAG